MSDLKTRIDAPKVSEAVHLLKAARAFLSNERKWHKGGYCYRGARCAMGALYEAAGVAPRRADFFNYSPVLTTIGAAVDALADELPGTMPIPEYNDDPTTTHADILSLFDRAIERASK